MEKPYMSVEEIADALCVGTGIVYILVRSGELKSIRVGQMFRVPTSEFKAFVERGGSARKQKASDDESQQ